MIFEKWDLQLNIEKLQKHLKENVLDKEISKQSEAFGGWSVLSATGDYKDGWQKGHLLLQPNISDDTKNKIRSQMKKKFSEYTIETEICTDYLLDIINIVRNKKLTPYRARIICLSAQSHSIWHSDCPSNVYAVRLHIPIVTNEKCFFETRNEREHAAADGSGYFVYVNREHRVINEGSENRYHLVMDVCDKDNVSKYHRFQDFKGPV